MVAVPIESPGQILWDMFPKAIPYGSISWKLCSSTHDPNNKFSIHPTTKLVNGSPTLYLNNVLEKEGLYYIKNKDSRNS